MSGAFVESTFTKKDVVFELPLRPQSFRDFTGQDGVKERLMVMCGAARKRNEALGHCLLSGPPGLGKTTLATLLSKEMGTNLVTTSGPAIEKPGDLAGVLTSLQEGDILFVDEIHRVPKSVEEYLYSAMEDFSLDIMIDSGPAARSVQVKLNRFTLAAATTRQGLLTAPLRSRFQLSLRLDYYNPEALVPIILRSARILNTDLNEEGAREIAARARGTPRIANNLLKWVRDYSLMRTAGKLPKETVRDALDMLEIDFLGLDEMDRKILTLLIEDFEGGPVGLNTISVAVGEDSGTIEDVFEPYLIMQGLIKRTPKGRVATLKAYQHLESIQRQMQK
ncbi:Holliday junction branch migration DNA helicase RuvB [Estrella lausannensis]|uniref:Holliday junction branch migration complex subunit RuvB n=1 Tax=Estrella lausannensis TaxID=483423 RepID=A0A0H5DPX4_9BACT|nr:Holliday junction branch migration DNA helicase RuvB [Estrella lausannensis]CRX38651.1 Holliday junction ATP-dependent DNA helicase ruvB [Estrella lausannensis]